MSSTIEPEGAGEQFVSDDELKSLLDRWIAPEPSKNLDQRVANSYHREMGNAELVPDSIPFPQSQKEVVTMKFCSTCREEFADKFSFCPVDGTPLTLPVSEPERVVVNSGRVTEPVSASAPVLAAAGSAALVPRGEFHLTMIDDAGLVGRLAKEVTDVAHQYQLTWPEFKRDPFGFTKRSLVGYGQMVSKFFRESQCRHRNDSCGPGNGRCDRHCRSSGSLAVRRFVARWSGGIWCSGRRNSDLYFSPPGFARTRVLRIGSA